MARTDIISFSAVWQYFFLTVRPIGLFKQRQLQSLKGKYHRSSGAIDFHLSMRGAKVCASINQIVAYIISPRLARLHLNSPHNF